MEILLFGPSGQLGRELQRSLAPLGTVTALMRADARRHADFDHPEALAATVRALRPKMIVNAAAWTDVDAAERNPVAAYRVNAEAVGVLAREAAAQGAWLVHFSTDYVFSGAGSRPWREDDPTGPLNVYGATKLAGEQLVRASGCAHLILRTGWVWSRHANNFVTSVRRRLLQGETLQVVDDQVGAPTPAAWLADVTALVLARALHEPGLGGTLHVAAAGEASWHGVATLVADALRAQGVAVAPVMAQHSADRPSAAPRPLNSRLDTTRLRTLFGVAPPDWADLLGRELVAWPVE